MSTGIGGGDGLYLVKVIIPLNELQTETFLDCESHDKGSGTTYVLGAVKSCNNLHNPETESSWRVWARN